MSAWNYLWEVNLILKKEEKPVTCLGKSGALGWTSWLQTDSRTDHIEDLLLQVENYYTINIILITSDKQELGR